MKVRETCKGILPVMHANDTHAAKRLQAFLEQENGWPVYGREQH